MSSAATIEPAIKDHVPVGTSQILDSEHVSEGPGRIMRAPVPSIFQDDRGDIHRLRIGHGQRMNILYSVKGVMRSGYLHPHPVHDTVISGRVEVWVLTTNGTKKTIYGQYQHVQIEPYVPHILHFLEDTILVEWWDRDSEFECWYYHPFRSIIDCNNSLFAKMDHNDNNTNNDKVGRHQRLVPQDDLLAQANLLKGASSGGSAWKVALGFLLGTAAGVFVGVALADRVSRK